jgi:acetylornithine/succinyldiaminopimelate/putrescine aminotransferase
MLMSGLSGIASAHIKDVRGLGLMIGIELDQDVKPIIEAGYERGIILLSAGQKVIRLLPPLIVSGSDIEQVLQALTEILEG